jgi:DNA-binding transcriptional ArsR family regulator
MDVAVAIADPVRRQILGMLARGELTAGEIAAGFSISRPAVSRHLRVLRQAGLVVDEARGRHRVSRLDPAPLVELDTWIHSITDRWSNRLDALETEVYRTRRERNRRARPTETEEHTA